MRSILNKPISITPLIVFRIVFGVLAFYGASRFLLKGWVQELYIDPQFYFPYLGFEWVKPLPGDWMYLPFVGMLIGSLGIILGYRYRLATVLYFLSFTYVELLDKTNYLNHYYFVSLVAFILIFIPAHSGFSLDAKLGRTVEMDQVPRGYLWLLQFQLACVYFFAGIAKLDTDWLFRAEPLFTWLQAFRDSAFLGDLFARKTTAYVFAWGGCLYDLSIVFFLLYKPTKWLAYLAVVFFHLVTYCLFPIGVFPLVMIFSTWIFLPLSFQDKVLDFLKAKLQYKQKVEKSVSTIPKIGQLAVGCFVILQLTLPFRYLAYPGDLFWNEEGFRFSWRVMLMHKEGLATFYIHDPKTGGDIEIDNSKYLTKRQEEQMSTQPDMILQYASFLQEKFKDSTLIFGTKEFTLSNPTVHADVFVSLNGRKAEKFIDRKVDLTQKRYDLCHRDWLEPSPR